MTAHILRCYPLNPQMHNNYQFLSTVLTFCLLQKIHENPNPQVDVLLAQVKKDICRKMTERSHTQKMEILELLSASPLSFDKEVFLSIHKKVGSAFLSD